MTNQIAIIAIVAAMGLVGVVAVQSVVISQQAFADSAKGPFHGCKQGSEAFKQLITDVSIEIKED
jgi:hypothetical protein